MDDIDRAQAQEEQMRALQIHAARNPRITLPATGQCHNCEASIPPGAHFCDADCRDDHERHTAARRREGLHK